MKAFKFIYRIGVIAGCNDDRFGKDPFRGGKVRKNVCFQESRVKLFHSAIF
jgi:hypothetical protein